MLLDLVFANVNVRIVVSSKESIHKSQDLSVVKHELSVVDPVVTSTVQELPSVVIKISECSNCNNKAKNLPSKSNAVVDGDTPAHNEEQGSQDKVLVHRNDEGHAEVREALDKSVD